MYVTATFGIDKVQNELNFKLQILQLYLQVSFTDLSVYRIFIPHFGVKGRVTDSNVLISVTADILTCD